MSDIVAIKVENLSKVYKLYNSRVDRLKEALHPLRRQYHHDFYALNDVSFEIKKSESVGIIGKNGSGKSTLLKILTGVLTPTSGRVTVNGKVSALLELGAGFNPELSGLENVYFNGMLMGYTREDMDEKLDEILSFADIGEFIYQPVKTYSSGMFVRLAFAVATIVDPDILIVDEALSVGDIKFQRKCFAKIEQFHDDNKTILFVSHALETINLLCDKAYILNDGVLIESGLPKYVTRVFQDMMLGNDFVKSKSSQAEGLTNTDKNEPDKQFAHDCEIFSTPADDQQLIITALEKLKSWDGIKKAEIIDYGILDADGNKVTLLEPGHKYELFSQVLVYTDLKKLHVGYPIKNVKGLLLFAVGSYIQNVAVPPQKRGNILEGRVNITMWLAPGDYFMTFRAGSVDEDYDELYDQLHFIVAGDIRIGKSSVVNLQPKVRVRTIETSS